MQVLQEIYDMEQNIAVLKQAITHKEMPLHVAHMRLDTRMRRPNIELCHESRPGAAATCALCCVCTCELYW